MATDAQPPGVRAEPPTAGGDAPTLPPRPPPVWPPVAQWCVAALLAVGLALVGYRGWGLTRYSTNPLAIERYSSASKTYTDRQATPVVRTKPDEEPAAGGKKKPAPDKPIDVNRATAGELMQLPGIGPVLAGRIVEVRREKAFGSVEDLRRVKGIGPKTLDALRPHVVVPRE